MNTDQGLKQSALPTVQVVMEHITTRDAAEFVAAGPPTLAATITPQHMLMNRNALFQARPHAELRQYTE